jgi:tRNA(Leu) C34 or U34 (ribose-2'-O)-methylase TrmL
MSDELRERVARACAHAVEKQHSDLQAVKALGFESVDAFVDRAWPNYLPQADAAIALVLEEAAKELDRWGDIYGDNAARTIRALKERT